MQKLIATGALLLAIAAPARAGLTAEEASRVIDLIAKRYAPMGLTADEITVLMRSLGDGHIGYQDNGNGTVTFTYERRGDDGFVVEFGQLITVRLQVRP